jgi:iron complex transport system substrate-binding protein
LSFGDEGRGVFESFKKRPLWKKLKAVQQGRIYLVNGYVWTGSSYLAANAVINDLYKYLINTP